MLVHAVAGKDWPSMNVMATVAGRVVKLRLRRGGLLLLSRDRLDPSAFVTIEVFREHREPIGALMITWVAG